MLPLIKSPLSLPLFVSLLVLSSFSSLSNAVPLAASKAKPAITFADPRAAIYAVGSHIPGIAVDVPPSYAGLMPTSATYDLTEANLKHLRHENYQNGTRSLFFWLWLADEKATNPRDLVIWLSGGPGCSSVAYGMFEETGPIDFSSKSRGPQLRRLTSWTSRANILYVEQPIDTGYSMGKGDSPDDFAASSEFYHFLNNLFAVFPEVIVDDDQYLYLVGESYGGVYAPYRATQLLSSDNTWGLTGMLLINGLLGPFVATSSLTTWDYVQAHNKEYLHLPEESLKAIKNASDTCHLTNYFEKNVKFPQKTPLPPYARDNLCDVWNLYINESTTINPNFDIYDIRWQDHQHSIYDDDAFGSPNIRTTKNPLNREDVREYIHAPVGKPFYPCSPNPVYPAGNYIRSPGESVLPYVVEKLNRTIVATAAYDSIIMSNGTFMILQNMTWAGELGFHEPAHNVFLNAEGSAAGTFTERDNLAFVKVDKSGHMIPADDPQSGLALLDALLGNRKLGVSKGR